MKQYIIVSYTSWRTTPSRAQQLSARLRDSQVLFFQPARPGRSHKDPGRQVRPNVTVYFAVAAACVYFLAVELPKDQQPEETF